MAKQSSVITEDLSLADSALQAAQSIVAQSLRAIVAIPLYSVSRAKSGDPATPAFDIAEKGPIAGHHESAAHTVCRPGRPDSSDQA